MLPQAPPDRCDVHVHLAVPSLATESSLRPLPPELTDRDALLGWLDANGLDVAAVSVAPPLAAPLIAAGDAKRLAARLNDELEELVGDADGRLRALAFLPIGAPEVALREAEHRQGEPWTGAVVPSSAGAITLDDAALAPLWELLDERESFVLVHPVDAPDPRLGRFHLGNLLGNPYETALAAACLIFSDIAAIRRRVRFCLAHAGGATAALVGRWAHAYSQRPPALEQPLTLAPDVAARLLYADTIAHSPGLLDLVAETFGPEHVVLGSDWPFPMGDLDP